MKFLKCCVLIVAIVGLSAQANARCTGGAFTGYIVAYGDCYSTRGEIRDPKNVCDRASNAKEYKPLIISDVFYYESDAMRRGTSLSLFHDEVTIQKRIAALDGSDTVCYDTRREAEEKRRGMMADAVRSDRQVETVYIDNRRRR